MSGLPFCASRMRDCLPHQPEVDCDKFSGDAAFHRPQHKRETDTDLIRVKVKMHPYTAHCVWKRDGDPFGADAHTSGARWLPGMGWDAVRAKMIRKRSQKKKEGECDRRGRESRA